MSEDLERALHRVVIESPVHGPVVVARLKELEANAACFVCTIEERLGEKRFTKSHPISCVDNWFRKPNEWDTESKRLGEIIAYLRRRLDAAETERVLREMR